MSGRWSESFKRWFSLISLALLLMLFSASGVTKVKEESEEVDIPTSSFKLFKEIVAISYSYHVDRFSIPEKFNEALDKVEKYLYEVEHVKIELPEIPDNSNSREALSYMEQIYDKLWDRLEPLNLMSKRKLLLLMIKSYCYSLDPFTDYMGPKAYSEFLEAMRGGDFTGVGIYIGKPLDKKYILVLEPIEGTPAYRAGLKPGDLIIAIDGRGTKDMPLELAQALIRGPKGTKVVLTIRRGEKVFDVPVVRDFIHVNSVKYKLYTCHGHRIAYLKIRFFGDKTSSEFDEMFLKAKRDGAEAIIIDLRHNTGGLMDAAVDVVSHFIPRGRMVVYLWVRSGDRHFKKPLLSRYHGKPDLRTPLIVLINRYTASASEITAQALKDYRRAVLVGEPTFGKNSVQRLFPVREGGVLKLTIAKYYTPSEVDISKEKVKPDIEVKVSKKGWILSEKEDAILKKGLQVACERLNKR